jgi:hypothetical protein
MFVPYQMLRNLAPETLTISQQRAADEQLGEIAAALSTVGRGRRIARQRRTSSNGSGGVTFGRLSKAAAAPKAAC